MLYSPNWDKQSETKADPFKLETLIAWLEKQPGDQGYSYTCRGHCMLAQYFVAMRFENVEVVPHFVTAKGLDLSRFPKPFEDIAIDHHGFHHLGRAVQGLTFGAALLRARAALAGA